MLYVNIPVKYGIVVAIPFFMLYLDMIQCQITKCNLICEY